MNTPESPKPSTPDLLGPVIKALKPLSLKDKRKIAEKAKTSYTTLSNVQRKIGSRGPNYYLVLDLYKLLIVQGWRP